MDELDEFMDNVGTHHLTRHERRYIDKQVTISCVNFSQEGRYTRFLEYQLVVIKNSYEDFVLESVYVDDDVGDDDFNYPVYIQGKTRGQPFKLGWAGEDILDPQATTTKDHGTFLTRQVD
jgi:hypothetical protein